MALATASLIALPILCAWVSGNASYILYGLFLPAFFVIWMRLVGGKSQFVPLEPDTEAALARASASAGVMGVKFHKMESGDNCNYPRPLVVGASVSLSRRVLREWSHPAIVWMVRAESLAEKRFARYVERWILASAVLGLLLMSYLERLHVERLFIAAPVALILGVVALASHFSQRFQLASDLECCSTEHDFAAAKEALSTSFFAQSEYTFSNRWLYSRRELSKRARNLGITLEKGFKVGNVPGQSDSDTKE